MVLRTLFCFSQNARRAICTRSLTSKLADSLRLIIWTAEFLQIEYPDKAAPRFHSPVARAFPSCHPERSEAKSNCEAASNEVQTGSSTEKFDKLRMTRSGKKQHPRMSAVLYRNNPKWVIISWSFRNIVRYREYREYRPIKCCTKFAPKSHQRSTLKFNHSKS